MQTTLWGKVALTSHFPSIPYSTKPYCKTSLKVLSISSTHSLPFQLIFFIYLLTVLGLCCCMEAFSHCGYINQHLFWGLMSVGIGRLNPAFGSSRSASSAYQKWPDKDHESPSSTRLEALVPSRDSRATTRSPSPRAWRPDFPGAAREAP